MKRKRIIPIALVIIAAAVAYLFWSGRFRGSDPNLLSISGNIELTQVDISFKVPGKLMERRFDEGQSVKKGDLVARIDKEQLVRQRERDAAGVDSAESDLQQMKTSIALQRETLASDIALKKAEINEAQAHLDEMLAGSRPQEIRQAHDATADARTQNDQAKLDWDRAQVLYKNDDISTSQFDQYRTRFNSTSALLRQAENRLSMVEEGPRKEDIAAARASVARADAALRMSEANRMEVERKEQELTARKAAIDRARAQEGMTDTQLNDTVVVSPVDGVVLVKSAEPGEVLAAGTTVLTIGDVDHPWLRGYVGEQDLGRVKLGMRAKITSDSFPGKTYDGRVTFIASQAEFTPKQIQTKEERVKLVYRIKIEADNPQHELKLNMPVEAELVLDRP